MKHSNRWIFGLVAAASALLGEAGAQAMDPIFQTPGSSRTSARAPNVMILPVMPDLSPYATKDELGSFAKITEIPNMSGYASIESVAGVAAKADVSSRNWTSFFVGTSKIVGDPRSLHSKFTINPDATIKQEDYVLNYHLRATYYYQVVGQNPVNTLEEIGFFGCGYNYGNIIKPVYSNAAASAGTAPYDWIIVSTLPTWIGTCPDLGGPF